MIVPGLTVLIPHDGSRASAEKLRRWYAEKVRPVAAVWSIEYGRHGTGYHLNIIADTIRSIAPPGARVLCAPIRTTVRATAAYITKRAQTPPPESTQTRNTGYMGRIIDTLIKDATGLPLVKAAALQQVVRRAPPNAAKQQESTAPQPEPQPKPPQDPSEKLTREQYRQIGRRALDDLYRLNEQLNGARTVPRRGIINRAPTDAKNTQEAYT